MGATFTEPYPYKNPLVDRLEPQNDTLAGYPLWQHSLSLKAITGVTHEAWNQFQTVANIIESGMTPFGPIARLEFFWDHTEDTRGVAIFDSSSNLVTHVVHALLGYEGSGPGLSEKIMERVGVPSEVFRAVQQSTWNSRPYMVVVSRQKHETIRGVDTPTYPTNEVGLNWSWWRAR